MEKHLTYNLEYADNGMIITQPEFDSIVVIEYDKDAKGKDIYENCAKELGKEIFEDVDQCNDAINGNIRPLASYRQIADKLGSKYPGNDNRGFAVL